MLGCVNGRSVRCVVLRHNNGGERKVGMDDAGRQRHLHRRGIHSAERTCIVLYCIVACGRQYIQNIYIVVIGHKKNKYICIVR